MQCGLFANTEKIPKLTRKPYLTKRQFGVDPHRQIGPMNELITSTNLVHELITARNDRRSFLAVINSCTNYLSIAFVETRSASSSEKKCSAASEPRPPMAPRETPIKGGFSRIFVFICSFSRFSSRAKCLPATSPRASSTRRSIPLKCGARPIISITGVRSPYLTSSSRHRRSIVPLITLPASPNNPSDVTAAHRTATRSFLFEQSANAPPLLCPSFYPPTSPAHFPSSIDKPARDWVTQL